MERLTSYKNVCKREMICRHDCDTCEEYCPYMNEDNCPCLQEVLEKLAAYEDIGLTPQQLKEVDRLYAEKCKELAESEKSSFCWRDNMERLTFVDEDGQVLFDDPAGFLEDVGFTIRELAKNEEWETLDNIAQRLANCEQRLKHYKDLEEQGKLLKLPCAVGDSIYIILGTKKIEERKVIAFKMIAKGWAAEVSDWLYLFEEFGKTIFLTKDEAEAALKEL